MAEFSDCVERAQRLSVAHETFLAKDNLRALMSLKPDDVLIYLRFLVSHFASLRKVHQYLRVSFISTFSIVFFVKLSLMLCCVRYFSEKILHNVSFLSIRNQSVSQFPNPFAC